MQNTKQEGSGGDAQPAVVTEEDELTEEERQTIERNRLAALERFKQIQTTRLQANLQEPSWRQVLEYELTKPYWTALATFLYKERRDGVVFPPAEDIFAAYNQCPFDNVKVVIIGQDPYVRAGQAHGMCFSVRKGVQVPPSLCNIYKELEDDIPTFKRPPHGYLLEWGAQGVLLLNTVLTVRQGEPNSHANQGWELFTDATIKAINQHKRGVVFLLWGRSAQAKAALLDEQRHHILTATHPSPKSADRGFFGCRHFSKTNEILEDQSMSPVRWEAITNQQPSTSASVPDKALPSSSSASSFPRGKKRSIQDTFAVRESSEGDGHAGSGSSSATSTGCFSCGQMGHWAKECPNNTTAGSVSTKRPRAATNNGQWQTPTSAEEQLAPLCSGHGIACISFTVKKEGPNQGRRFYRCSISEESQRCDTFIWEDGNGNGNAWSNSKASNSSSPRRDGCFKCGGQGHWANHCPMGHGAKVVSSCFTESTQPMGNQK
ncbi:Uracil-DNA glycosylase [Balamuthia mandrillaris]